MRHVALVLAIVFAGWAHAETRPSLTGTVYDDDEKPLVGATVMMYTAKPRVGPGIVCPSCYADCGKKATTAADGTFTVPNLDPALIFKVIVVAEGYFPQFLENVDPGSENYLTKLSPQDPERMKPGHVVRGRVLDVDGLPIAGAEVSTFGMKSATVHMYGSPKGVDELAVTNEAGEFALASDEADVTLFLEIEGRGIAPSKHNLRTEDEVQTIVAPRGATVTGRIVKDGAPVGGALVGLVQMNREASQFLGEMTVNADEDGRFVLSNVPQGLQYCIYGKMESMQKKAALEASTVYVGQEDTVVELDDLAATQGSCVSGRIELTDGSSVPEGTSIILSRAHAWDFVILPVNPDGTFMIENVPAEEYSLSTRVPGYRLAPANYSLGGRGHSLNGRIENDITGLRILLEPGEEPRPDPNNFAPELDRVRSREPLRGAEAQS